MIVDHSSLQLLSLVFPYDGPSANSNSKKKIKQNSKGKKSSKNNKFKTLNAGEMNQIACNIQSLVSKIALKTIRSQKSITIKFIHLFTK